MKNKLNLVEKMIQFYEKKDVNYFMSNFYPAKTTVFGLTAETSEHIYQAAKFIGVPGAEWYINEILAAKTPTMAFVLGRMKCNYNYNWAKPLKEKISKALSEGISVRPDWDKVKIDLMLEIVSQKFLQHPILSQKLLATGDKQLVEHTHRDNFWADGGDGSGKNHLGIILMKVRSNLKGE